jgi:cytochrome c oxidase assembly protein subunit 15
MEDRTKLSSFAKFAWFVLACNLLVILWGVFLRASKSGDGCGQHWLTCQGEVVPSAPELKTVIEFSHRITSSIDGLIVIALLVWATWIWYKAKTKTNVRVMKMAIGSFVFVAVEGLLGAGLVLTGNTAENLTPERPFWMAAHLVNTLVLLALLSLTAWFASDGQRLNFRIQRKYLLAILAGAALIFMVGISGSIAALSGMLFPSATIAEGLAKDFSPTSNVLLRLRLLHPILSILTSVILIFASGWLRRESNRDAKVARWSNTLSLFVVIQIAFGAATLLTLAPIVMQLAHLFLADAVWISFVLLSASFLGRNQKAF